VSSCGRLIRSPPSPEEFFNTYDFADVDGYGLLDAPCKLAHAQTFIKWLSRNDFIQPQSMAIVEVTEGLGQVSAFRFEN
jgi:hypothetical protein